MPQSEKRGKLEVYANDTLVMASSRSYREICHTVKQQLNKIHKWTKRDKTKLNATKSIEVVYTNRRYTHMPLFLRDVEIPHDSLTRYLGLHLDSRLKWGTHSRKKIGQVRLKVCHMQWLIGYLSHGYL